MTFLRHLRGCIALVLAGCLACPPASALVTLNDGRDRIYVTGTAGIAWDSNVFAANGSAGDYILTSGLTAEYQRRAGWIGVNGRMAVNLGRFDSIDGQDFSDPSFSLEFTKQTGRTTGSVTLGFARESRADAAVNTRSESQNYNAGLNFKYHIVGNFDLAGQFGYSQRKYADSTTFSDLSTYNADLDLFHVFSSERDVILGYRYRFSETSRDTSSSDHGVNLGLHGKIVRGINGTLRVGYQTRTPHGGPSRNDTFSTWTASGSVAYALNKKTSVSAQISKDFSTTAVDTSVDTLTASLDAQYALSSRWMFSSSVAFGDTRFLGDGGRVLISLGPPAILGPQRHDNFFSWTTSASFALNEHLKIGMSYLWFQNWSTIAFADFTRSSWNVNVSSRW